MLVREYVAMSRDFLVVPDLGGEGSVVAIDLLKFKPRGGTKHQTTVFFVFFFSSSCLIQKVDSALQRWGNAPQHLVCEVLIDFPFYLSFLIGEGSSLECIRQWAGSYSPGKCGTSEPTSPLLTQPHQEADLGAVEEKLGMGSFTPGQPPMQGEPGQPREWEVTGVLIGPTDFPKVGLLKLACVCEAL